MSSLQIKLLLLTSLTACSWDAGCVFTCFLSTVITSDMSGQRGSPVSTISLSPHVRSTSLVNPLVEYILSLEAGALTRALPRRGFSHCKFRSRQKCYARQGCADRGEPAPPVTPGTGSGNNPEKREIKDILVNK
ncbi:hypothetical protein CDAR_593631 [Caerostris darwini]|uniref:Secreted protein n=1 Tax=Caerostris darwini TaxID=1538125 RepID=A0AAV4RY75_9ARAC|nr:hypothetical protein CDAR_593631 [Caerostris darwini]